MPCVVCTKYAILQIPKCINYNFKNFKFCIPLNGPELRLHGGHWSSTSNASQRCARLCCDTIYILQIPQTIPKCMVELS